MSCLFFLFCIVLVGELCHMHARAHTHALKLPAMTTAVKVGHLLDPVCLSMKHNVLRLESLYCI